MNSLQTIVNQIVSQIDNDQTIEQWKKIAGIEIKGFAKRANPFKGIQASNYYIYIDTKTLSYGIILQGVKPNAGAVRGFGAPINKRVASKSVRVKIGDEWKTVKTARKTGGYLGLKMMDDTYLGLSGKPDQFFGLKKKGKIKAFGIVDDDAVKVYSDEGFVEWLTSDSVDELVGILEQAGFAAISEGK